MANQIKYSTGSETLALKKGNFYIGTGDVGKGPTSSTGYYSGIEPPSGGYTVYLNKASGGPSIYTCTNDTQLISLTNKIAGQSYTTANECLSYFAGQTDKIVLNRTYEPIVTNGLVLNLDAGFTPSYPRNGTTWYDNGITNCNGTLTNGPTYSNDNIIFDGSDDRISFGTYNTNNNLIFYTSSLTEFTVEFVFKLSTISKENTIYRVDNWTRSSVVVNSSNNINFVIGYDTPTDSLTDATTIQNNTTYYVTCVFKKTEIQRIYINGILSSSRTPTVTGAYGGSTNIQGDFNIGRGHSEPFARYITGDIGLFRWYTSALTSSEVLQNYNAQKGRFGL
jgi:hypothetical protein